MQRGSTLPGLTGLRFFAAVWVLFHHAGPLREASPRWLDLLSGLGFTAVPLFYVLSGFVLTWSYGEAFDEGRASVGRFLLARAARIYPLYLLALGWTLWNISPELPPPRPLLHLVLGLHAWQPSWVWFANIPAWSVSNELFFYALFPFLIVLVPAGRSWLASRRGLWLLIAVTYALSFVPWLATRAEGLESSFALAYWPPYHLGEFVIGMAVGRLALHEAASGVVQDGSRLVLGALAGILLVAWGIRPFLSDALLQNGLLTPLHGLLVYGLARGGWAARPFSHPAIVRLGELGYAIYILQSPVWTTLRQRVWDFEQESGALLWLGTLGFWAVLVAVAAVASKLVESPLRAALRDPSPRALRTLGAASAVLLALAGAWTFYERASDHWGPKVVVVGDFEDELGCARDWDPGCGVARLRRVTGGTDEELLYQGRARLPAGTWTVNTGIDDAFFHGGPDQSLVLESPTEVTWLYSHRRRRLLTTSGVVVTAPGTYQHLVGCTGDWQPDCLASWLLDLEGDGILRRELELPAGHYEMKATVGFSWDENYGRDGARSGENVSFDVPEPRARVLLRFDPETHVLTAEVRP